MCFFRRENTVRKCTSLQKKFRRRSIFARARESGFLFRFGFSCELLKVCNVVVQWSRQTRSSSTSFSESPGVELSPKPESLALCCSRSILRAESLLVLQSSDLEVIYLFFLKFGGFFGAVLFFQDNRFGDGKFRFGICLLGIDDEPKTVGK